MVLAAVIALGHHGPIPQSQSYHGFADKRALWGIPHFLDVMSNLAFILVGLLGLYECLVKRTIRIPEEMRTNYSVFFIGVALVGVGSGYYHLAPEQSIAGVGPGPHDDRHHGAGLYRHR